MKSLVLSVSPNASTDRVSVVDGFIPGMPARTILSFDQAGGSGAHATGVVQQLGGDACSLVLLGSYNRDRWILAAQQQRMSYDYVDIDAPNRSTFVLIDKQRGTIAEVIDPGPLVEQHIAQQLLNLTEEYLDKTGVLILSGSLPPGIPSDFYVQAIHLARRYRVKVLIDASSTPLQEALKVRPWAIKPNLYEFHQIVGTETRTIDEHIEQLNRISGVYADIILLSLGQEGLLVASDANVWHLTAPHHKFRLPDSDAVNTVGCGDALVGGFSYAYLQTQNIIESACWGIAAATVTLGNYGVPSCPQEQVQALVREISVASIVVNS